MPVVDASVVVHVLLGDEFSEQVRGLLDKAVDESRALLIPPHMLIESVSAVYQRLRGKRDPRFLISERDAEDALRVLFELPLIVSTQDGLYQLAFAMARDYDIASIYDALYVAVAQLNNDELWTADRRLYEAARQILPRVIFVGGQS